MAKIYCKNTEFNGISATVNFENGVGVTDDPYLISWFMEHGYTVEEGKKEVKRLGKDVLQGTYGLCKRAWH